MRLFLRRIVIIIILLLIGYLVYGRVNPTGAEKVKMQLQSLDLPRQQAKERAEQLLIREVDTTTDGEIKEKDSGEILEEDKKELDSGEEENSGEADQPKSEDNGELMDFLESELEKAEQEKAEQENANKDTSDNDKSPTEVDMVIEAESILNVDSGELSDGDLKEIEALLKSLLEE